MSYCKVIGNKCETDNEQVLFYCWNSVYIDHCIFLNNSAKYMFQQYYTAAVLTISDSYIDSNSTTGSGTVKFENLKRNYDFDSFSNLYKGECLVDSKIASYRLILICKFAKCSTLQLFSWKKVKFSEFILWSICI